MPVQFSRLMTALLLGVLGLPVVTATQASAAPSVRPELVSTICAAKKDGRIRVPDAGKGCRPGERTRTLTVDRTSQVCRTRDGALRLIAGRFERGDCRDLRGSVQKIPGKLRFTLCVPRNRPARWLRAGETCRSGERTVRLRNLKPRKPGLVGGTVADQSPVGTLAGTLSVIERNEGDRLTWRLVAGTGDTDNASFKVQGDHLLTAAVLDHAVKASYSVRVQAKDLQGRVANGVLTVTVTPTLPEGIVLDEARVAENAPGGSAAGRLAVTPAGVRGATWTLVAGSGDRDNADFRLDGNALLTARPLDFEAGATRHVRVRVTDRTGAQREQALAVAVADVNEAPTALRVTGPLRVTEHAAAGAVVATLTAEDPDAGDSLTFEVATPGGTPGASAFEVVGDELRTARVLDDSVDRFDVRLRVKDRGGLSLSRDVVVTLDAVNDAPTGLRLSNSSVLERKDDELVGTLSPVDRDGVGPYSYALVAGTGDHDNALFVIDGDELRTAQPLDLDDAATRSVRIAVSDAGSLTYAETFSIEVLLGERAPHGITLTSQRVAENATVGTVVGSLGALDRNPGDTHTYALPPGALDNGEFGIENGALITAAAFDHESTPTLQVRIVATDSTGRSVTDEFTITVTDVNEAPSAVDLAPSRVAENQPAGTTVGTFSVADPDTGDTHSYALVPGALDNVRFEISGDTLLTAAVFDHESQDSYRIRVRASDSMAAATVADLTVTVTDGNDAPTGLTLSATSVAADQVHAEVGTLDVVDPDGTAPYTYTLVAGDGDTHNVQFEIVGTTLRAAGALTYDGVDRTVRVRVVDADGAAFARPFTITVRQNPLAPTDITLAPAAVDENEPTGTEVGSLTALDANSDDTHTFALVSGLGADDNDAFTLVGDRLRTAEVLDHEARGGVRSIRVRVTDSAALTYEKVLAIIVRDLNEAPSAIVLSATSVPESAPSGTTVGTLSATDQDVADSHTFALVGGSADNDSFAIVGNRLTTATALDFEAKASYTIRVRVTDGGGEVHEQDLVITVTDVNESPHSLSLSRTTVQEGIAGALVGTVSAQDAETPGALTYTLVGGAGDADNALFTIAGDQLRTRGALDIDDAASRSVRIRVTDAGGEWAEQRFALTVLLGERAPTAITLSPATVAENEAPGTVVGTLGATDRNPGDTHTFELVAGAADNADFALAGTSLATAVSLDHETQPTRTVRIRVTDSSGLTLTRDLVVTVSNVNEAPTDVTPSAFTIAENRPAGSVVGTLSTVDPDRGDSHTYALVAGAGSADNASFTLVGDQVRTASAFDFETKASFTIRVETRDSGGRTHARVLTVTVTDVNESPTDLRVTLTPVNENNAVGAVLGSLDWTDPDAGDTPTYSVVSGPVTISGSTIRARASYDFEDESSHEVTIRVSDGGGLSITRTATLTINDVNEAPVVTSDAYGGVIGNTRAYRGPTAPDGPAKALTGALPLANDTDPEGDALSVVAKSGATTNGGFVTIAASGTFVYDPPAGAAGTTDTFTYQVSDGSLFTTATMSLSIGTDRVWYVNTTAPVNGTGTSYAPFQTLAPLNGSDPDGDGDVIFVASGTYATGITLEANQELRGRAGGLTVGGTVLVAPAPGAVTTISVGNAAGVVLADGAKVHDLDLASTGTGIPLTSNGVNSATVASTVRVSGGTGAAVSLTGGTGEISIGGPVTLGPSTSSDGIVVAARPGRVTFSGNVSTASSTTSGGVKITGGGHTSFGGTITLNTGARHGLEVVNSTITASQAGNTLRSTTGTPLTLTNAGLAGALRFASVNSSGAVNGIVVRRTSLQGSLEIAGGIVAGSTGTGVVLEHTPSPALTGLSVTGGAGDGVTAAGISGVLTFTGNTVTGNAGDGLRVASAAGGNAGVRVTDNTIDVATADAIQVASNGGRLDPVVIRGNTLTRRAAGTSSASAVVVAAAGSNWIGDLAFDVRDNDIAFGGGQEVVVSGSGVSSMGRFEGYVRDNRLGGGTCVNDPAHASIQVLNESGTGTLRTRIVNNTMTVCSGRGVSVLAGDGASSVSAQLINNTVTYAPGPNADVVHYDFNLGTTSSDTGTYCVAMTGNLSHNPGAAARVTDLLMRHRWSTVILPGYTGPSTASAVETWLATTTQFPTVMVGNPTAGPNAGTYANGTCAGPSFTPEA